MSETRCIDCYATAERAHQPWCNTLRDTCAIHRNAANCRPRICGRPVTGQDRWDVFEAEMREVINRNDLQNLCDTPDHILARYLRDCLSLYASTVAARRKE